MASKLLAAHKARVYAEDRLKGRTNLLWLCNEVLGYRDVETGAHGQIIDLVQPFLGRKELIDPATLAPVYSHPACDMHDLPGPRWRLLLYPRGGLKTSINVVGHGIQWILNYPEVREIISVAAAPQADDMVRRIMWHFRYNEKFRFLYPEFCPQGNPDNWGSLEGFTVPNHGPSEFTIKIISVGKTISGIHCSVMKHSDLVDKENARTPGGLAQVKDHFKYCLPLLESPDEDWMDMEGTIYHMSDLYMEQMDEDAARLSRGEKPIWVVVKQSAEVDTRNKVSYWPRRFSWEALKRIEAIEGPEIYSSQYLLNPTATSRALASKEMVLMFASKLKRDLMPRYRIYTTVDLAGMEEDSKGAHTAIVTCGWLRDARLDVLEAKVDYFTPFEVMDHLFRIASTYRPVMFRMEKAHHAQVLAPFIAREEAKRGVFLNMDLVTRDSSSSKHNRISGLQPWFHSGLVRFSDDIDCMPHIINEITKFPKYRFMDFLDALADQLQFGEKSEVPPDARPRPKSGPGPYPGHIQSHLTAPFIGFDPRSKMPSWADDAPITDKYAPLGVL